MKDSLAVEQLNAFDDLFSKMKAERSDDWQIIAQYALPQDSDINTKKTEGVAGWTDRIFDTTTIHAMETLAAGLFNWWTPPNQPWAEYDVPEELKGDEEGEATEATVWLGKASDKAMKELGRSNFYMAKATGDLGLAVFATDLIIADESDSGNELFNFIHVKIGTYVIEENYKGIVDTIRRELKMTFRQIEQKFGKSGDTIPDKMRDQSKGKGANKEWRIVHCIFPREDSERLPKAKNGKNKPIASVYIAADFKEVIRVSGYDESPILCRRFKKWATVWGYGPGYLALPDSRQVNYMQQYMDAAAEILVDPRVLIPDNLEGDVDLRAGGATIWDSSNPNAKPEEWAHAVEYKLGMELMEQKRQAIREACFVDAFKLLNSAPLLDKEMTAYEISQRQAEQLQNMTAVDARSIPEFVNPLMNRVFGIMFRAGKLKDPPSALQQQSANGKSALILPEVVVTSRFNDALRALKNRGAEETMKFILPQVEAGKPEVMDIFELDDLNREYARNTGIAPDAFRKQKGKNSVEGVRAARAAAMQQERAAAMAVQMGQAGASLGKSPQFMQDQAQAAITKPGRAA